MKRINHLLILMGLITIVSCTEDNFDESVQDKLTKSELIDHLKSRNSNFKFYDENVPINGRTSQDIPEPIYFESVEEMDAFLDAVDYIKGESNAIDFMVKPSGREGGGNGTSEYYEETRGVGASFGFAVKIGFYYSNCIGSGLRSWGSGFTTGLSYRHNTGNLTSYYSNYIRYHVKGTLNYNLFLEGIGTIFYEDVTFTGNYYCD